MSVSGTATASSSYPIPSPSLQLQMLPRFQEKYNGMSGVVIETIMHVPAGGSSGASQRENKIAKVVWD